MKVLAWLSTLIIVGLNVKLVFEEVIAWINTSTSIWWIYVFIIPMIIMIIALLLYVFLAPLIKKDGPFIAAVPHGSALEIGALNDVNYSRIGITVDFSKNDRNTIRHALMQGGKLATYYLIHIVETAGAQYHGKTVLDHETLIDADNLKKYQENLQALGYLVEAQIGYGNPANAIAETVKSQSLDLLVMGAHGHKGISDLIFGTTVGTVRHNVNIPVLIIK